MQLRFYAPESAPHVVEMWNRVIGASFPLREPVLRQCLEGNASFRRRDAVLAWDSGRLVGFGYITLHRGSAAEAQTYAGRAHLQAVVVDAEWRRRGVGRAIVAALSAEPKATALSNVEAGGGVHYLWPAIPEELPGATAFMAAIGFELGGRSFDLRGNVSAVRLDSRAQGLLAAEGLHIEPAVPSDRALLLRFVRREFGFEWWHDVRHFLAAEGSESDFILLRDRWSKVLGFAQLHGPASRPIGPPLFWAARRPPKAGGLGPIGVASALRGRGLGRALLVSSLERLHDQRLDDVVIDFTDLLGFYGPLGFAPWMAFRHGTAPVTSLPVPIEQLVAGRG